jgi:cytochrome c-type biogenesis protein
VDRPELSAPDAARRQPLEPAALRRGGAPSRKTFLHALAFVLGFSLIFIVGWGGAATALGSLFAAYKTALGRIGGVVVILFGLMTADVIRISWLMRDTRFLSRARPHGLWNSGVFGVLFAAGWSPCIGTTLGAILTLGISQETTGQAMLLSSGYALGLAVPFLVLALMLERALGWVARLRRHQRIIQRVSGAFLVAIGVLMLTNRLTLIAIWAQRNGFYLDLGVGSSAAPTYLAAVAAGLLSFLSPCVLPLVPAYLGYLGGSRGQASAAIEKQGVAAT